MESAPDSQEVKPGNQGPLPGNYGIKFMAPECEYRQLGTFSRQPWNQDQATRNLHKACMEPSPDNQEMNPGNPTPSPGKHGTKSWQPGTNAGSHNLRQGTRK